jgi:hypothetical protein
MHAAAPDAALRPPTQALVPRYLQAVLGHAWEAALADPVLPFTQDMELLQVHRWSLMLGEGRPAPSAPPPRSALDAVADRRRRVHATIAAVWLAGVLCWWWLPCTAERMTQARTAVSGRIMGSMQRPAVVGRCPLHVLAVACRRMRCSARGVGGAFRRWWAPKRSAPTPTLLPSLLLLAPPAWVR